MKQSGSEWTFLKLKVAFFVTFLLDYSVEGKKPPIQPRAAEKMYMLTTELTKNKLKKSVQI